MQPQSRTRSTQRAIASAETKCSQRWRDCTVDSGVATQSYRSGTSLINQALPCTSSHTACRGGGSSSRCGSWVLSKDSSEDLGRLARGILRPIATSLILRLSEKDGLEEHFNRNSVAILPESTILAMHRTLDGSLAHATAVLISSEVVASETVRKVAADLFEYSVELLVEDRFPASPGVVIANEFRRAVTLHNSMIPATRLPVRSRLSKLFRRTIGALEPEHSSSCILDLFSLPIPGVDGFEVAAIQAWTSRLTFWDLEGVVI